MKLTGHGQVAGTVDAAMAVIPLPPHAYVPGKNKRHLEGQFEDIRQTVTDDMTIFELVETQAWQAGLAYLQGGYFWEAHEVLEPVWWQTLPNSSERFLVQALIQLANAKLKERMGRERAVERLCSRVSRLLQDCEISGRSVIMELELSRVRAWLRDLQPYAVTR